VKNQTGRKQLFLCGKKQLHGDSALNGKYVGSVGEKGKGASHRGKNQVTRLSGLQSRAGGGKGVNQRGTKSRGGKLLFRPKPSRRESQGGQKEKNILETQKGKKEKKKKKQLWGKPKQTELNAGKVGPT